MRVILSCLLFIIISAKPDEGMKLFIKVVENLSSTDTVAINKLIEEVRFSKTNLAQACQGALLMKKADLVKRPAEKLSLFKEGRRLLEVEITKDSTYVNFRILQLIIQENCPAFLKYKSNIDDDANIVQGSFSKFSNQLQDVLLNYAKNSKHLKLKDRE